MVKNYWTKQEDDELMRVVNQHGAKNWKQIARKMKNRSDVQCLHRWQKVLNPEVMKGPWNKDEDYKLKQLIEMYGAKRWSLIARQLNGRIGKQCRERWYNQLDPSINKQKWTKKEDDMILQLHIKYGNKWSLISKELQGRTDNAVKNRFNGTIKRKLNSQSFQNNLSTCHKTKSSSTFKSAQQEDRSLILLSHTFSQRLRNTNQLNFLLPIRLKPQNYQNTLDELYQIIIH